MYKKQEKNDQLDGYMKLTEKQNLTRIFNLKEYSPEDYEYEEEDVTSQYPNSTGPYGKIYRRTNKMGKAVYGFKHPISGWTVIRDFDPETGGKIKAPEPEKPKNPEQQGPSQNAPSQAPKKIERSTPTPKAPSPPSPEKKKTDKD